MPLDVDRLSLTMDVGSDSRRQPMSDADLRERLRPVVIEILNTELERLRRQHG